MTLIGYVGIPLPVAYVLRLNLPLVSLCALLPDLIDKSLWALCIAVDRYIAHTLLFMFLVAIAFFIWRRAYGLSALVGGISHLLLELNNAVPWFYPFDLHPDTWSGRGVSFVG